MLENFLHPQRKPSICYKSFPICCCWAAKSCPTLCNPMGCSMPDSQSLLRFMSIKSVMLSNDLILCHPLLLLPLIFSSIRVGSSHRVSWLFALGGQSIAASALTSVLQVNIQGWFPLSFLVWPPCSPRDFQESSPAPQFKSIILYLSFSKPLANTNLLFHLRDLPILNISYK